MTSPDCIVGATTWLATTPYRQRPYPLLPYLRRQFDLTITEAIEAIRQSHLQAGRAA